jgi:isopentenyl-diphosphate delta-isomerase
MDEERVVLLDDERRPAGTMPKSQVHGTDTPLHLAFSVYVFDAAGRFLTTRRALTKRTWAGVWSNSCCGHPGPDEPVEAAVERLLGALEPREG